jgi:hypothetical protein
MFALAVVVVCSLVLMPLLLVFWTSRRPTKPHLPSTDPNDAWLAKEYKLSPSQVQAVRIAAFGGQVIDPDGLRPATKAFALHLLEHDPPRIRPGLIALLMSGYSLLGAAVVAVFVKAGAPHHIVVYTALFWSGLVLTVLIAGLLSPRFQCISLEWAIIRNNRAEPGPSPQLRREMRMRTWSWPGQ